MPSYEEYNDEEELMKLMNKTDDFEERKKIRARLREIREKLRLEREEKRIQREKETEDLIKKKYQIAEEEKKKKMQQYRDLAAKPTSDQQEKYLSGTQHLIEDRQKLANDDKQRKLEAYKDLASHHTETRTTPDGAKVTTTTSSASSSEKTPGGGTRTTTVKKTETTVQKTSGFGGMVYGKPGAAKPAGAKGAMAAFKQMDATANPAAAKPNAGGSAGGGKMVRSPSAIKQMLLDWCKAKTREYENIDITNFSSSWNNGLAFCALIHHFFPDSFNYKELNPKNRRYNFTLAFDTAEKMADIAPLLDVEDMVRMQKPDWKCVFTYVQSIYRHLRDHDANKVTAEQ